MASERGDEGAVVYVVRCPIGGCSKKGGIFGKKSSADEAIAAVKHHLMCSPYHELDEHTANKLAEESGAEAWPACAEDAATIDSDSAEWFNARKRQKTEMAVIGKKPRPHFTRSEAESSSSICLRSVGEASTDRISLSRLQVQAMVDTLRRAHTAAESAAMLAAKVSRAFAEEALVIDHCEAVLSSYLQ